MALPIQEHLGKSTLLQLKVIDPPDAIEHAMAAAFDELQNAKAGSLAAAVLQGMRSTPQSRVAVVRGLVYGVLGALRIEDASAYLVHMQAAVASATGPRGDEWADVVELCKYFCYSHLRLMRPQPRAMLVWLVGRMMLMCTPGVEALVIGMLRNVRAGCCDEEESVLMREILGLFSEHESWMRSSLPANAAPFVAYTLLRVLSQDRLDSDVRELTASIVAPLIEAHLQHCAVLGRDLVRALVDVAELPKISGLWAKLLSAPPSPDTPGIDYSFNASLQDNVTGDPRLSASSRPAKPRSLSDAPVALLLRTAALPRFLAMRVLPAAEAEARFIAREAADGREFVQLVSIFLRDHVPFDDAGAFVCDMIRFLLVLDTPSAPPTARNMQVGHQHSVSPVSVAADIPSGSLVDTTPLDAASPRDANPQLVHGNPIHNVNGVSVKSALAHNGAPDAVAGHVRESHQPFDSAKRTINVDETHCPSSFARNAMAGDGDAQDGMDLRKEHDSKVHGSSCSDARYQNGDASLATASSFGDFSSRSSIAVIQSLPQDGAVYLIVALLRVLRTGYDASRAKLALFLDAFFYSAGHPSAAIASRRLVHVLMMLSADGRAAASVLEFVNVAPRLFFAPLVSEMARGLDAAIRDGAAALHVLGVDVVSALVGAVSFARFGQQSAESHIADRMACIWAAEAFPSSVSDAVRCRAGTLGSVLMAVASGVSATSLSADERAILGEQVPRLLSAIAESDEPMQPDKVAAAIRSACDLDLASADTCNALRSTILCQSWVRMLLLQGAAGTSAHLWALEHAFGPGRPPLDERDWRLWAAHVAAFARSTPPDVAHLLLAIVRSVPHPDHLAEANGRLLDMVIQAATSVSLGKP